MFKQLVVLCFITISRQGIAQNMTQLSQDTVYLTIPDAEQRFVNKNLTLLLNKYNVNIARDNYLQAKLWYNPNIYYGTTLYNVETHKWFQDYYPNQNSYDQTIQVQQLLTLAGKHNATAKLAKIGIKQAEFQVADILRSLKYELYTHISDLYTNLSLAAMYVSEEEKIKHLLESSKALYKAGNASGNDVIRLQAQLQDIMAQETTSRQAISNDEQDLGILLVYPGNTYIVVKELGIQMGDIPSYVSILDSAKRNRPDLKLAYAGVNYSEQNLKLQRATGMPDVTIGGTFTGANAVTPSYTGIYASMDLPVWNRNQWNITAADMMARE